MTDQAERLKSALADRYTLEREIGRGGMAVVYLAEDVKHGRKVAIKVFQPEFAASLGADRFLREIEIAARLNHPHILPLHDSGEVDGFLYYVMPYMEGDSLRDRIDREGQLPVEEAVRYAREVAGGLQYAHAAGVIHRDIKPANIMLSGGHAVIADFGIAQAVDEAGGERLTHAGISTGSPIYMSPEQASGSERLDGRTDIYALACMLYEMLAGEPPFTGASLAAILARKQMESAPPLGTLRATVPGGVEAAVARGLAPVPADRFTTAGEFETALKDASAEAGSPAAAVRTAAGPGVRGDGARRAVLIAAVILIVGAVLVGVWLTRGPATGDAPIRSLAVLPFADMSPGGDQAYIGDGIAEVLLNALADIPDLRVTGRSSSFQFDQPNPDLREVGRVLDVAAVLEGSVRADEDTVRITVQLVNAADGFQLWSEAYAREAENIFATQEEIAREIVRALGMQLAGGDTTVLVGAHETSPEVYDLYLRGLYLVDQGLELEAVGNAVDIFLQAIALDSTYAPAYAGLSRAYGNLSGMVPGDERGEVVRLRQITAERALALDDQLPEAVAALAGFLTNEGRFEEAEREYLRALDMSPGNAAVQSAYADMLLLSGRQDESIREARHAVAIDPLSLESHRILIAALYFASRHEEVLEEGERILEIDPNDTDALLWMQGAYSQLERHEESIAAAQRLVDLDPENFWSLVTLAYAYAESGDREATLHALGAAQELGVPLKESAIVYGLLGELDTAYEYLERALVEEPEHLFFMEADPSTAPLQADPRWDAWWAKVKAVE